VVFWSRVVGGCGKMTVGKDEKSTKSKNRKIDQIWSKLLYHLNAPSAYQKVGTVYLGEAEHVGFIV
jgi:hypothetical protein